MMQYRCGSCNQDWQVDEQWAGQTIQCPYCGAVSSADPVVDSIPTLEAVKEERQVQTRFRSRDWFIIMGGAVFGAFLGATIGGVFMGGGPNSGRSWSEASVVLASEWSLG
jgi:uncharacterized protein YcfJ